MLKLTSQDWFHTSAGQGVVCKLPDSPGFPTRGEIDPEVFKPGDDVEIDGKTWKCTAIEYFVTNPPQLGGALSMLVEAK